MLIILVGGVALRRSDGLTARRDASQAELLDSLAVPVTRETLKIRVESSGTVISKDPVS